MTYHLPDSVNTQCGIYMIKNNRNGKKYIGSTKSAHGREVAHFKNLRAGKHHCDNLQNAWNKEKDPSVFVFSMFIFCKESDLKDYEQNCFDTMKPEYNSSGIAHRPEHTTVVRRKMSLKRKQRVTLETTKQKTSLTLKGVKKSPDHCSNISKGRKGMVFTDTHIESLRISRQTRKSRESSPEFKHSPKQQTYRLMQSWYQMIRFQNYWGA